MNKNGGFTLLEAMMVVAILAVLLGMALPSFNGMLERGRLKTAVESLKSDLQFARTEAIKQSQDVIVSFDTGAWCYGLDTEACDCTTDGDCGIKTVNSTQFNNITFSSSSYAGSASFDPRRGTATAGNVCLSSDNYKFKVVVSTLGRVRICSSGQKSSGYPACGNNCS